MHRAFSHQKAGIATEDITLFFLLSIIACLFLLCFLFPLFSLLFIFFFISFLLLLKFDIISTNPRESATQSKDRHRSKTFYCNIWKCSIGTQQINGNEQYSKYPFFFFFYLYPPKYPLFLLYLLQNTSKRCQTSSKHWQIGIALRELCNLFEVWLPELIISLWNHF